MSMKPVRKFLKPILDWVSEVQVVKYPLWLILGPVVHKITAKEIRKVLSTARSGDIIFRRQGRSVSTRFIPGFYSHVGIVKNKTTVIHAVGKGVVEEDILDFCRTDALALVRIDNSTVRRRGVKKAVELLGTPYDYIFDSDDKRALYCSELVMFCFPDIVPDRQEKRDAVSPDELMCLEGTKKLYDSRDEEKEND